MADGPNKAVMIIGDEEYQLNQRRIEEARRYIDNWDAMNEQAKKEYDRMQEDLQKKIREGEDARRMLKVMQEQQATRQQQLAIAGPSGQHAPQVTNHHRTNRLSTTSTPVTTSRIEEIPPVNHPPQQSYPTVSTSTQSSNDYASTSAQGRQYPPKVTQQRVNTNAQMSGTNPNWTLYSSTVPQNSYPNQPGPLAVVGAPLNMSQPVVQQQYRQPAPTPVRQQQQQPQVLQGQPLHARPGPGPSNDIQQRTYSAPQASVAHLSSKQQQNVIPIHVQQHGNPYMTHYQTMPHYTTHQVTTKPNSYLPPPLGTAVVPVQTQHSTSGAQNYLNTQAKTPMGGTASMAFFAQASSSLAGALGGATKASATTMQNNNTNVNNPVSLNAGTSKKRKSGIKNIQATSMASATPPASSLIVPVNPQGPPQTGPGNTSSMTRLKTLIANWERDGPPQSYFELPGTKVKIYKDNASKVYLVTPDKKGGYAYFGASSLDDIFGKISQSTSKPDASGVYPNTAGHTHVVNNPRTAEQATVYKPHGETLQPPAPVVISLGEPQPVVSSNGKTALPILRTPKDADKAHLARDILRALTKKRPRPEGVSTPSQEPSAKRHALDVKAGRTLDGVIPNTVANPPMPSAPLPVISQPSSQPPTSGPTQPIPSSQFVFRIDKQAPVLAPPSMTVSKPTAPPNVVSPVQSTVNINNSVSSVPQSVIAPSILPVVQPPSVQNVLPPNLGSASSSSNLAASRVEPILRQSSSSVSVSELNNGKEKTPLFLPSPSSSPPLEASRGASLGSGVSLPTNIEVRPSKSGNGGRRKRQLCYVLIPPLPNYVKRSKANERASIKEDIVWHNSVPASDGFATDNTQSEAVELSCSRLSKRPCRLSGCDAVLNSTQALLDHISQEHRPKRIQCQWPQCGRRHSDSKAMFYHIRSHALIPLECAYKDCQESFRTPQQLVRHHEAIHRNSSLKPSAALFTPELSPLPAAPERLPAYMVEARQVQPPSISKDRHNTLGPWVLRNISGPANLKTKRYNAAQPLRSQNREQMERRPGNQPYDFMTNSTTNFSTTSSQPAKLLKLDDLPSVVVSEMTFDGMVLWQAPEVKVENPTVEIRPTESRATTDELTLSGGLNQILRAQSPLSRGDNHSDEEAVKNMLTG